MRSRRRAIHKPKATRITLPKHQVCMILLRESMIRLQHQRNDQTEKIGVKKMSSQVIVMRMRRMMRRKMMMMKTMRRRMMMKMMMMMEKKGKRRKIIKVIS